MRPRLRFNAGIGFGLLLLLLVLAVLAFGGWSGTGENAAAVEITAPPATVYPYVASPELWSKWMGDLVKSEPIPDGPKVGAKTRFSVGSEGDETVMTGELTQVDPGKVLGMKIQHGLFDTTARYDLKERAGRTVLVYRERSQYHSLAHFFAPIVTRIRQAKLEQDLLALKTAVETTVPQDTLAATPTAPATIEGVPSMTSSDAPLHEGPPTPAPEQPATEPASEPATTPPQQPPAEQPPVTAPPTQTPPASEPVVPATGGPTAPEPTHPAEPAVTAPAEQKPAPEPAATEKPPAENAPAEKPASEKPPADQPAPEPPAPTRPPTAPAPESEAPSGG